MRLILHAALLIATLATAPTFAASKPAPAAPVQPALAALAAPHADDLSAVGINRIVARTGERRRDIQVMTDNGPLYFGWPDNVTPVEFVIDVAEGGALRVRADGYTDESSARYHAAMEAILREAVLQVRANNVWAARPRS
jgi:hypothetical protein